MSTYTEHGYILINLNPYGLFCQGIYKVAERKVMKLIGTYCDKYCEKMYMTTNCDEDSKINHMITWDIFWRLVNIDLRVKGWQWGRKFNLKQWTQTEKIKGVWQSDWAYIDTHTHKVDIIICFEKNCSCHYLKWINVDGWICIGERNQLNILWDAQECVVIFKVHNCGVLD